MRKFFELLYFGAYYFSLIEGRVIWAFVAPCVKLFLYCLSYISPGPKRNMAEKGITMKQFTKDTLDQCKKIDESNLHFNYVFHIRPMFVLFYTSLYFDLMVILCKIFGHDWGIIQINSANAEIILAVICGLACYSTSKMKSIVGQNKIVRTYGRKSKSVHRKTLALYLGCFTSLLILSIHFLLTDW